MTFYNSASLVVKRLTIVVQGFHRNIELKTSKHEFAGIRKDLKAKKLSEGQAGRNSLRLNNMCCRLRRIGDRHARFKLFLPRFSCLFSLLSTRILQNNLLDLYLVEIRRYKLSFFAKQVTNTSHVAAPFSQILKNRCVKLKTPRGLKLST